MVEAGRCTSQAPIRCASGSSVGARLFVSFVITAPVAVRRGTGKVETERGGGASTRST